MHIDKMRPIEAIRSGMQSTNRGSRPWGQDLRPTGNSPSRRHLTRVLLLFLEYGIIIRHMRRFVKMRDAENSGRDGEIFGDVIRRGFR